MFELCKHLSLSLSLHTPPPPYACTTPMDSNRSFAFTWTVTSGPQFVSSDHLLRTVLDTFSNTLLCYIDIAALHFNLNPKQIQSLQNNRPKS